MLRVTVRSLGVAGVHSGGRCMRVRGGSELGLEQSASVQGGQGQGGSAPDHESAEGGTGVASGERERVLQCREPPPGGQNAELSQHVVCSETVRTHMSVTEKCEFAGRIARFGHRDAPVEEY